MNERSSSLTGIMTVDSTGLEASQVCFCHGSKCSCAPTWQSHCYRVAKTHRIP